MTDNEIIKALKECEKSIRLALDFINRQKAEIEELKEKNEEQRLIVEAIDDNMFPLPFETDYDKAIKNAKAEAIKEFIDNLVKEMVGEDNA